MLRDRMTALHGNSDSESSVAAGLSGSMPGIVYYEFAKHSDGQGRQGGEG